MAVITVFSKPNSLVIIALLVLRVALVRQMIAIAIQWIKVWLKRKRQKPQTRQTPANIRMIVIKEKVSHGSGDNLKAIIKREQKR